MDLVSFVSSLGERGRILFMKFETMVLDGLGSLRVALVGMGWDVCIGSFIFHVVLGIMS